MAVVCVPSVGFGVGGFGFGFRLVFPSCVGARRVSWSGLLSLSAGSAGGWGLVWGRGVGRGGLVGGGWEVWLRVESTWGLSLCLVPGVCFKSLGIGERRALRRSFVDPACLDDV